MIGDVQVLLTEALQVVARFANKLATSYQSPLDFLTATIIFSYPTKRFARFGRFS